MCNVLVAARGAWHGDVAIKVLDFGRSVDLDAQLAAFKLEVRLGLDTVDTSF